MSLSAAPVPLVSTPGEQPRHKVLPLNNSNSRKLPALDGHDPSRGERIIRARVYAPAAATAPSCGFAAAVAVALLLRNRSRRLLFLFLSFSFSRSESAAAVRKVIFVLRGWSRTSCTRPPRGHLRNRAVDKLAEETRAHRSSQFEKSVHTRWREGH